MATKSATDRKLEGLNPFQILAGEIEESLGIVAIDLSQDQMICIVVSSRPVSTSLNEPIFSAQKEA